MGKRTRQQSSNGIINGGDSSESDGDQNSDKSQAIVKVCQHAGKSVEQNQVKKNIHLEDIENNNFCLICSKQGQSIKGEDVWVCLRCGAKACSLEHSQKHNEIPHSDSHSLSLKLSDKIVWCHLCKSEIPASSNKKLKGCVNNVENMYEKYLQGPPLQPQKNGTAKMDAIVEEEAEDENKALKAVPVLPPKIKTPPPYGSPVRGLVNLGNTCYFNSVIQCLAQTPNLIETLKEMGFANKEVNINLKSGRTLSGTLEKWDGLCESLCETLSEVKAGGPTLVPQLLLTLLRKRVPQFRGSDQHDSHELLRHLLDSVRGQDLKRYRRLMLNELGLSAVDENPEKVDPEKKKELKQLDREVTDTIMLIPDQVFRGFLVSRLECQECSHSSDCVESFLDLSLPVTSEKPQPPSLRRKGCGGGSEERNGTAPMSKHQLKKERKLERKKNRGKHHGPMPKKEKEAGQGEGTLAVQDKGESDVEGDVESEGSDRKIDKACCSEKSSNNSASEESSTGNSVRVRGIDLTLDKDYTKFPLCNNGLPDIAKLSISDPNQPQLKTIVRDAATIVKEDPMSVLRLMEDDPSLDGSEEMNGVKKSSEPSEDLGRISEEGDQHSEEEDVMVGSLFDETNSTDTAGGCSVQSCLAQFTSTELMTGNNKVGCEQCTARANKGNKDGKTVYTMSTKQFLIAEAPPVLILHLKRFQVQMSSFRKLARHVSFPLELDLSPFCKEELRKKTPKKLAYSLYGIVEHSGTFNGGHYVAYVKVESGRWFYISDSHVSECKEARVLQAQAYLLFYKSSL